MPPTDCLASGTSTEVKFYAILWNTKSWNVGVRSTLTQILFHCIPLPTLFLIHLDIQCQLYRDAIMDNVFLGGA